MATLPGSGICITHPLSYMPVINPYLNFNGNTEEAFLFYKSVFGGEFSVFQCF